MLQHYLLFDRTCGEALDLYAELFGGKIEEKQTYGDMPPDPNFPITEADKKLVLHSRIIIDGAELMCADASEPFVSGGNMYISITMSDMAEVQKAWDGLKTGGKIYMDLAPAFFAQAHGSLQDKYGINWMFTVPKSF